MKKWRVKWIDNNNKTQYKMFYTEAEMACDHALKMKSMYGNAVLQILV